MARDWNLAGRIGAKTGANLLAETTPARLARGEGRVSVEIIPYLPEQAVPFLQKYEQLILVGALFPVTTFAYKDKPLIKVPRGCQVTTLATVEHDIWRALGDLADAVGAPPQSGRSPVTRSNIAPSAGSLTDVAVGQSLGILLPENAILVTDCAHDGSGDLSMDPRGSGARLSFSEQWRSHRWRTASGIGSRCSLPGRKTVVVQGDGSGMYTIQALWTMAREKADVTVVVMKNDNYGVLNIELARVREGDPNDKMLSMLHLDNPSIDWVKLSEAQGVPATRAKTAEEFHQQFEAAMGSKGPHLIEANIVQNLQPEIDAVHNARG